MAISPETSAKIEGWRRKAAEGKLTPEEMREAVALIRGDRISAQHASTTSRTKKAIKEVPSASDMLKELGL